MNTPTTRPVAACRAGAYIHIRSEPIAIDQRVAGLEAMVSGMLEVATTALSQFSEALQA